MAPSETKMEFAIMLPGGALLSEAEAMARAAEAPEAFQGYPEQEGRLVMTHDGEELLLDDVLGPLCLALVREVIPGLADTGQVRVMARSTDVDVDFALKDGMVTVSTDVDAPLALPRDGFETAARAVARRYCDLALQLWPEDENVQAYKAVLDDLSA